MGRRCDCEKNNLDKNKRIIVSYFGVNLSEVKKFSGRIYPKFYDYQ